MVMVHALQQLRQDHANFARLLDAIAHQADVTVAGGKPDIDLLKAIITYFESYPTEYHHPKEDIIYGHLICQIPRFGKDVYALLQDHQDLAERTARLKWAIENMDVYDGSSQTPFCREAHSFVAHERAHLNSEEQLFFPQAERLLTAEQWAEVDRFRAAQNSEFSKKSLETIFKAVAAVENKEAATRKTSE